MRQPPALTLLRACQGGRELARFARSLVYPLLQCFVHLSQVAFGDFARRDVNEGNHDAGDAIFGASIRQYTAEIPVAQLILNLALFRYESSQHLLSIAGELGISEAMRQI